VPIYEFLCGKCGKDFELMQSLSKRTATAKHATKCGGRGKRKLSIFSVAGTAAPSADDFADMSEMGGMDEMGGMPGMEDMDLGF
jgi:putative FmdB family regulatory protein